MNEMSKFFKKCGHLSKEKEIGNEEYKWKLVNLTESQKTHRLTQLNWRLNEGNGKAIYRIGFLDNGFPQGISEDEMKISIDTLNELVSSLENCNMSVDKKELGEYGITATITIKRLKAENKVPQYRIAVAGNVNSGKSTLVGVITKGKLDNSLGSIRNLVFQHNHEFESGRTSSITTHSIYFDHEGSVLNSTDYCTNISSGNPSEKSINEAPVKEGVNPSEYKNSTTQYRNRSFSELELADEAITSTIVSLIDLAGHEKYLKTTLHGLVGRRPDYCMLAVSASSEELDPAVEVEHQGCDMTGEHLGIISAIKLPFFIVLTKIDKVSDSCLAQVQSSLFDLIRTKMQRAPIIIKTTSDVNKLLSTQEIDIREGKLVPILASSSVSGRGIDLLKYFIFKISKLNEKFTQLNQPMKNVGDNIEIRVIDFYNSTVSDDLPIPLTTDKFNIPHATKDICLLPNSCQNMHAKNDPKEYILNVIIENGNITVGQNLKLGPTVCGVFLGVIVRSIYINRVSINQASLGQVATIAVIFNDNISDKIINTGVLKPRDSTNKLQFSSIASQEADITTQEIPEVYNSSRYLLGRKNGVGLVLLNHDIDTTSPPSTFVDPYSYVSHSPFICYEFDAYIQIIKHHKQVGLNYEPVVHALSIRQSARISSIKKNNGSYIHQSEDTNNVIENENDLTLKSGEKALCRLKFLYRPEYLKVGTDIVLREGRTIGIGTVVRILRDL